MVRSVSVRSSKLAVCIVLAGALVCGLTLGLQFARQVGAQGSGPCDSDPNCGCGYDDCPLKYEVAGYESRTATLSVTHQTTQSAPVRPNLTDTWKITATWKSEPLLSDCPCDSLTATATVDVWWDDAADEYKASCTGCKGFQQASPGPIYQVDVCTTWDCWPDTDASSTYELIVDLAVVRTACEPSTSYYLWQVDFASTEVDDGYVMDGSCDLGSAVSPTSQTWTATDYGRRQAAGDYECPFNCQAVGPSITITYE